MWVSIRYILIDAPLLRLLCAFCMSSLRKGEANTLVTEQFHGMVRLNMHVWLETLVVRSVRALLQPSWGIFAIAGRDSRDVKGAGMLAKDALHDKGRGSQFERKGRVCVFRHCSLALSIPEDIERRYSEWPHRAVWPKQKASWLHSPPFTETLATRSPFDDSRKTPSCISIISRISVIHEAGSRESAKLHADQSTRKGPSLMNMWSRIVKQELLSERKRSGTCQCNWSVDIQTIHDRDEASQKAYQRELEQVSWNQISSIRTFQSATRCKEITAWMSLFPLRSQASHAIEMNNVVRYSRGKSTVIESVLEPNIFGAQSTRPLAIIFKVDHNA